MERAFCKNEDRDIFEMRFKEDIEFAYKAYPKEIDTFMKAVKKLEKSVPSITADVKNSHLRNKYRRDLTSNIQLMQRVYTSNAFAKYKEKLEAEKDK